jgi:hypothetical protein
MKLKEIGDLMFRKKLVQLSLLSVVLFSCGSDQQQIVKSFSYNIQDNVLSFNVEFGQEIELNTELNIPILDYGSVTLTPPASGKGFLIGGTLNMDYINDERIATLSKTRLLPNNQAMSTYITQDLGRVRIRESDLIHTNIYLGTDAAHMYLGTALELGYIDQHFPAGLVISGRINDSQKRTVGVISIFGPNVRNGQVISPGGFFFATNISDLIKYYPRGVDMTPKGVQDVQSFKDLIEINRPYQKQFSDPFKLNNLLQKMRRAGQEAGYID